MPSMGLRILCLDNTTVLDPVTLVCFRPNLGFPLNMSWSSRIRVVEFATLLLVGFFYIRSHSGLDLGFCCYRFLAWARLAEVGQWSIGWWQSNLQNEFLIEVGSDRDRLMLKSETYRIDRKERMREKNCIPWGPLIISIYRSRWELEEERVAEGYSNFFGHIILKLST